MSIVVQLEERNSKLELQFRRQMPVFNPKKLKLDEWRKEQARLTQADQRVQELIAALEVRIWMETLSCICTQETWFSQRTARHQLENACQLA